MSFFKRVWRIPALTLITALSFAACADDDGALPTDQDPPPPAVTGTISGKVTNSVGGAAIVGALVGTSPATATALTDAQGNYVITNIPIPTNPTSYAVTASKEGFTSASTSVSLSATAPTATANLALTPPPPGQAPPTTGTLNVLVTNREGIPQSGAAVVVLNSAGATVLSATTNAQGFALFSNVAAGSYTVRATKTISGLPFRASAGANVRAGETAFLQLSLGRDLGQTVFPNVGGTGVTLDEGADIDLISAPGGDDNPEVDCNIIRTQHMFIAEVTDGAGSAVSGVKVEWSLNISENGTLSWRCPDLSDDPAGCAITTFPGNTGSVVDSDDPDLNPVGARSGLAPSFNVDTRKAITFTNDNSQTVSFGGENVAIGAGQTWIIITSPVEGQTDVIVHSSDLPRRTDDCATEEDEAFEDIGFDDDSVTCEKEFGVKRWVNWDTNVAELDWDGSPQDPFHDPDAEFGPTVSEGGLITNILSRSEPFTERDGEGRPRSGCRFDIAPSTPGFQCHLTGNDFQVIAWVTRLREDSPFNFSAGDIIFDITDDSPDADFLSGGGQTGCGNGVCNVENNGPPDDEFSVSANGNQLIGEFDANNSAADGGIFSNRPNGDEDDFIGWVVAEVSLDELVFNCVDVDLDGDCEPGAGGSPDSFSTGLQRIIAGTADNTIGFRVRFVDEFGEVCDEITFRKRFVTSRLTIVKSTPDAALAVVDGKNVKRHTVQVGQQFRYTVTTINDGEIQSRNVRITDTLPRFGDQFSGPPDLGSPAERNGSQAFRFVSDRPAFDPRAIVYAIDIDNDEPGNTIDVCFRGDDGSVTGNAYTVPAACTTFPVTTTDQGSIQNARDAAIAASNTGTIPDQVVWIQWFDDVILGRQQVGGGIQSEDTVEVTLVATPSLYSGVPLPGSWCNIATVTDLDNSFDADTLCHEVRQSLLDVRKTARDAVLSGGATAVFDIEIANLGSAPLTGVVVSDTLDATFGRKLTSTDIAINAAVFPTATVTINPDSFSFSINVGTLNPTAFVRVATVSIPTPTRAGVFCNRVTSRGTNPVGTLIETDIACVTTTPPPIEFDVSNEDGFRDAGGVFQSSKETFRVGDGGAARPDSLIYQVIVTNRSAFTATGVRVVDAVAPNNGNIVCRTILTGFPTRGTTTPAAPACNTTGFTWNIGTLPGGASAEIQFRAEALAPGSNVGNRVTLTADQLTGAIVDEEPTTVQ
ncbi:MAG: carboxypeptidase regulatory-like domain-containing protein [Gemmatimonadota bacterium]